MYRQYTDNITNSKIVKYILGKLNYTMFLGYRANITGSKWF